MMQAGVPLPEAMGVLGDATKNVVFQEGLADVHSAMMRGEGLARPMSDTKLFPGAVIQMIKVGENTGTLNEQLGVGSDYYGEELEYKIQYEETDYDFLSRMLEEAGISFYFADKDGKTVCVLALNSQKRASITPGLASSAAAVAAIATRAAASAG